MITKTAGKWRTRIAVIGAMLVAAMGLGMGSALADATATSGFGSCYIKAGICIPRGSMTITTRSVGGSGSELSYVDAGFTYFGQIHDLWIDHNFYDASGNRVAHIQGLEQYGNFSLGSQDWVFPSGYNAPKYGKHCATLFSQENGYIKNWKTVCNTIG